MATSISHFGMFMVEIPSLHASIIFHLFQRVLAQTKLSQELLSPMGTNGSKTRNVNAQRPHSHYVHVYLYMIVSCPFRPNKQ